jgi:cytochrome c peroxidase
MLRSSRRFSGPAVGLLVLLAGAAGFWCRDAWLASRGETPTAAPAVRTSPRLLPDTAAAYAPDWDRPYPQMDKGLLPCPPLKPGDIPPQELYRYGGAGRTSYGSFDEDVGGNFDEFCRKCSENKPKVMEARREYMKRRYNFTGAVTHEVTMSRSKPLPVGPVVRLPEGVSSWEKLAEKSPEEIRAKNLFPEGFRPLSHPLHTHGHQLFPQSWTKIHPEHERFDVDFDIPDAYLPEFPPPLFLTSHPELGDVSKGYEITQANFRQLFDGLLTPEQLEGLRLLTKKFPTTWFNQTPHRLTREPMQGTACLDCHVNGHTNGAIALDPAVRPTLLRVRTDTPSLRGNFNNPQFSTRRSIRSMDHFAEVEEYFDGDHHMQGALGGRQLDKPSTNRMGDFNAIIGWPPAPKLNVLGKLIPSRATPSELRGEALFNGKAQCAVCHPAPTYIDGRMHDLQVERFYPGRAEGWIKTFSLRGIKDSPPYFHDGRLPTLEDTVEFFNLILELKLSKEEKKDLVAFLRTL